MNHLLRAAFAVFALFVVPQFACAGPILWGYRAVNPEGTVLAERTGQTDLFWSDYFLPDPRNHGTPFPDPIPDNHIRTDIMRSEATVTITDETSGQTGSFWLYTDYRWQYEVRPDGSLEPIHEGQTGGPYPERTELVLGGNRFSLVAPGGELMVQITPASPTATPEPSTLALAALGLGAVGYRLRRRARALRELRTP